MRRTWVIGCRWPTGSGSPGRVTSTTSSRSFRSSSSSSSRCSRSATAASSRSRMPFRSMPLSRSRTPRSAWASSLLRPRYRTRASSRSEGPVAAATAALASRSYASQSTAATVASFSVKSPPRSSVPVGQAPARNGRSGGAAQAPGSVPGPGKEVLRGRLHAWKHNGMSSYDAIARLYDPWSRSVTEDVSFYVSEARHVSPGPVVELGVGTGRIAVPVAAEGIRVIGVDSSPGMLEVCRERAASAGVAALVELRMGDLGSPPVHERVELVICPFRSYLHLQTDEERLGALRAAQELLIPGGRLIFDVFAPGDDDISETHGRWLEREPEIFERADWDTDTRTLTLSVRGPSGEATMALAWLSADEWRALLERAGFEVEALYGWFDRRPFRGGEDMVWIARR